VTRKIGEGIQYRAFETRELEDGKVLKQPLPKSEMYRKFMWRNKLEPWRLRKARSEVQRLDESREHARDLVEDLDDDARSHLGDPKYTGELKYTQTKVSPSDRGRIDINDIEQIAQDYANIQRELWKHGCHDPVFHFLSATGYDDKLKRTQTTRSGKISGTTHGVCANNTCLITLISAIQLYLTHT
jgi:hypothetical protein